MRDERSAWGISLHAPLSKVLRALGDVPDDRPV